jgi:hypothetical protein
LSQQEETNLFEFDYFSWELVQEQRIRIYGKILDFYAAAEELKGFQAAFRTAQGAIRAPIYALIQTH